MTTALNTMQPARLAIFIALALAGVSPTLYASETFNTELVELDNPGMGKRIYLPLNPARRRPGHTMLILFLTIGCWKRGIFVSWQ